MTIKTGLELFKSIWLIEPQTALSYLQMWEQYMQHPEGRLFRSQESEMKGFDKSKFFAADNNIAYAPVDLWSREAENFNGFEGAETVIIPVEGPLMKNDYCGYAGTSTLNKFFQMAEKAKSVQQIILLADSPGGTVDGTQLFAQTIAASQKEVKTVIAGMCCSAMYWIGSSAKGGIWATSNTDIIGSIGTKVTFYDRSQYLENMGIILREYTATRSADKGKDFNEAAKGNGKLLIKSMLDPMNDEFLAMVEANRNGKIDTSKEDVLTGKTYVSKDALKYGLIDGVSPLEKILEQSTPQQKQKSSFSMKNFKLVLAAAAVASVYEEDKFFGVTEAQLEKVESALQAHEDAAVTATAENTRITGELATANTSLATANTSVTTANDKIKTLEAEIVTLKAGDGAIPKTVQKESDVTPEALPKTSVDIWWENLNK